MLLWDSAVNVVAIAKEKNLLDAMLNNIINSQAKITLEHERQRVILGICEVLVMANKPQ
jgi:hypothetical protein